MTSTIVSLNKLPPTTPFLNSVCPGFTTLDDNVHYTLNDSDISLQNQQFLWPLTESTTNIQTAQLNKTYLNISRPPIFKNESNTYVSLPNHITSLFKAVVNNNDKGMEGNLHIGANINPLSHDPFRIISLNPGCITKIVPLHSHVSTTDKVKQQQQQQQQQDKNKNNPFNKFASNFNRLLSFGNEKKHVNDRLFHKLLPNKLIHKVSCDETKYIQRLTSEDTDKLLISSHVNVLNVFTLNSTSQLTNTKTVVGEKPPLFTLQEIRNEDTEVQTKSTFTSPETTQRVIQEPLIRIQFKNTAIITCMTSFVKSDREPIIVCGFETGVIVMIRLLDLTYSIFDDLGLEHVMSEQSSFNRHVPVTSIEIIHHVNYNCLIVAGFSNGEVCIIDPYPSIPSTNGDATLMTTTSSEEKIKKLSSTTSLKYHKTEVGSDSYITYFKKFDLSPMNKLNFDQLNQTQGHPCYLLGHFKLSHKPITAISSTLEYCKSINITKPEIQPMILAIAADDGFVRFIDLVFTYNLDFGDETNKNNHSIVTDIISNYFNDGITDVQFSPDFKFVCIVGKGDLIEIFKMTYYNVNGLLAKNTGSSNHVSTTNVAGSTTRRSRSGTINSIGSSGRTPLSNQMFLSPYNPYNTSSVASVDASRNENNNPTPRLVNFPLKETYPPMIKDIQIVGRFKGHTNTVKSIQFLKCHDSTNSVYKLISCGFDGKTIFWEFDYKALPKVKKPKEKQQQQHNRVTRRRSLYKKPARSPSPVGHRRIASVSIHRSLSSPEEILSGSFANLNHNTNITGVLSPNETQTDPVTIAARIKDQIEIIVSIYKSLFDVRLKRHYRNIYKKSTNHQRHEAIISPIVNDKLVPSIEIPLASIDLSGIVYDGKIDGFYIDDFTFWIFAKNGDLFTYTIG